jgi:hypothetical protein
MRAKKRFGDADTFAMGKASGIGDAGRPRTLRRWTTAIGYIEIVVSDRTYHEVGIVPPVKVAKAYVPAAV